MNVIEGILNLFHKASSVDDALKALMMSKEAVLEMLENQIGQCQEIITDPELMDHEKGPYRVQLKQIKIAVNKIKAG